jgi:hypothetical protein
LKRARLLVPLALGLLGGAFACATLGEELSTGHLPNAAAGPFRELRQSEVGNLRSAPNVLEDGRSLLRDPAIVDLDGDPATLSVFAYVAATVAPEGEDADPAAPPNAIQRFGAEDGRSFDRAATAVLVADLPWEGGQIGAPAALLRGGELALFYAAQGGIGLATGSVDGALNKQDTPVLGVATTGWDAGLVPTSPGVVSLEDGSIRLFYAACDTSSRCAIGEASSSDGVTFTRLGEGPVLAPWPADAPTETGDPPYDDASVSGPAPWLTRSTTGRVLLRLYYGATDASGRRTVALASRDGTSGPFVRALSPVFGTQVALSPREPALVPRVDHTLLFATQDADRNDATPVIAAGVAPASATLQAPVPP